jgi:hypothetical protein
MSRINDILELARDILRMRVLQSMRDENEASKEWMTEATSLYENIDYLSGKIILDADNINEQFILELADEIYLIRHELEDLP